MATIQIKNLRLRSIIGLNDWERKNKQDLIINIKMEFDHLPAAASDNIDDTVNYRSVTKEIIPLVEQSSFFTLEKLAEELVAIILNYQKVISTKVTIDKPHALRFADSVSVTVNKSR